MAPKNTDNIDQALGGIVQSLRSGNTVIFCGAGVSCWSGLPMAVPLLKHVLTELDIPKKDIATLIGAEKLPLPFEVYLQILLEDGVDFINEVYVAGEPNPNHILFAKMMKMGYLKTIVTTNFDKLIERALDAEGLSAGSGYDLLFRASDFARIDWSKPQCRLIKIHGSVDDPTTLAATIRAVAAQQLSESRKSVIERIFSTGSHSDVLVLGYSCSDVFDIMPQIESLGRSTKRIVLNEHSEDPKIESINKKKDNNAFKQFRHGWRLQYDTDILVDRLWKEVVGQNPPKRKHLSTNWQDIISDMLRRSPRMSSIGRHFYPAQLLMHLGKNELARLNLAKAMQEAKHVADHTAAVYLQAHMAQVCFRLGEYAVARGWCEHMLQNMSDTIRKSNLGFIVYNCMGDVLEVLGDITVAAEYYEKALQNAQQRNDPYDTLSATQKCAVAYIRMGRFEKGMYLFISALERARQNGDKQLEGMSLGGIGNIYKDSGLHAQAIQYLEMARMIAHNLGDRRNEGVWLGNLGSVYQNVGNHLQALEFYTQAKEIAVMVGEKANESDWLSNMGISYKEIGKYTEAFACYESAIAIDRLLGNKRGLGSDLNNLGNLYRLNGMREQARQCFLEAIELAVEIGDTNAEARRKHNLQILERG